MDSFSSHPFGPFFDTKSEILILGSFPSPQSRESCFYYGNKANRFWKILAILFKEEEPLTILNKKSFLKRNKIALFDAIESLDIAGSSDSSIQNAVPSDLSAIFSSCSIRHVYCNGKAAYSYYHKGKWNQIPAIYLPSSSSANASFSLDRLVLSWKIILEK